MSYICPYCGQLLIEDDDGEINGLLIFSEDGERFVACIFCKKAQVKKPQTEVIVNDS